MDFNDLFQGTDISRIWYRSCAKKWFPGDVDDHQAQRPRVKIFAAGTHHAAMPEGYAKFMNNKIFLIALLSFFSFNFSATAQPAKPYRIGVLLQGGPWYDAVDGLRQGLKDLGLEDGKQFFLDIRDAKGDPKAVEEAARNLERDKVQLIYAVATSVVITAKQVTTDIPIVFAAGTDPVAMGLVESFAKPGGRLTGVHLLVTDLTAKRLEILKEILPKLRGVLTFYNPGNQVAKQGASLGREEAKRLGLKFIERHVKSVDELRQALRTLKAKEADAFFYTPDAMVLSQAQLIIDSARAKRLATMFQEQSLVAKGALASYGQSYYEIGRLSAKYVQKVLSGANPRDLRIETFDDVELVINLKTAKELGITVPPNVLARANKVIK
jgi:putative ABC transport system substrate-binding protein